MFCLKLCNVKVILHSNHFSPLPLIEIIHKAIFGTVYGPFHKLNWSILIQNIIITPNKLLKKNILIN